MYHLQVLQFRRWNLLVPGLVIPVLSGLDCELSKLSHMDRTLQTRGDCGMESEQVVVDSRSRGALGFFETG